MTRLDCLAYCARYYQYYEYAILLRDIANFTRH